MSSRSRFELGRPPQVTPPTIGRQLRGLLRRALHATALPFTAMWTNIRGRRLLSEAYAAQVSKAEEHPTRAWRRDFIRTELRRLRPLIREQGQSRLTYRQLWRLSLTAAE